MALGYLSAADGYSDAQLAVGRVNVIGWSARESWTGPPERAAFVLRDGTSASDPGVVFVNLAPGASTTFEFSKPKPRERRGENDLGVQFTRGVFLDRITGQCEVAVFTT